MTENERELRARLQQLAENIDTRIQMTTGERMGFALLVFSDDGKRMEYVANCDRPDVIAAMKEFIAVMDKDPVKFGRHLNLN